MISSLLCGLFVWGVLSMTPFIFIPLYILKALGLKRQAWFYLHRAANLCSRAIFRVARTRFVVEGTENIPKQPHICVVANHQSYTDIITLFGILPFMTGYIAKKELGMVPLLRMWMVESGCYFMKRDSLKDGLAAILHGVNRVKQGYPMVIFPEGTRSRGKGVGPFHKGSLKLATKAKATILPVSLQGTYRVLEETGKVRASVVSIKIHRPIATTALTPEQENTLADDMQALIDRGVNELKAQEPRSGARSLPLFSTRIPTPRG